MSRIYIVMGVSGCGKTTIGELLAARLDLPFYDADDFHPQKNVDKMASGIPLQDADRWPWLDTLAKEIRLWEKDKGAVLACSALKEVYRERLFLHVSSSPFDSAQGSPSSSDSSSTSDSISSAFAKAKQNFIFLDASFELISNRLTQRKGHFFDPSLLKSQFDTLEVPEYGIRVDAGLGQEGVLKEILKVVGSEL